MICYGETAFLSPYLWLRVHLLFVDSGQHHGHDCRDGGILVHGTSGDHQLHPVAALPEDLSHLFAPHAVQVSFPDSQDVVPTAQASILRWKTYV